VRYVELGKRVDWLGLGIVGHNSAIVFLYKTVVVDSLAVVHNQRAAVGDPLDFGMLLAAAMCGLRGRCDRSEVPAHKTAAERNSRTTLFGSALFPLEG
jgi:hypothetical protein